MQKYVAGLLFSEDLTRVLLIEKQKPEWQRGLLNAIGGKIETYYAESPREAMDREFWEEVKYTPHPFCHLAYKPELFWSEFCILRGKDFEVAFFCATSSDMCFASNEEEQVGVYVVDDIVNQATVENIPWLIYAAIDHLQDGRPKMLEVRYP